MISSMKVGNLYHPSNSSTLRKVIFIPGGRRGYLVHPQIRFPIRNVFGRQIDLGRKAAVDPAVEFFHVFTAQNWEPGIICDLDAAMVDPNHEGAFLELEGADAAMQPAADVVCFFIREKLVVRSQ